MKVYHGSSSEHLQFIRKNGISPRGERETNWEDFPSKSEMVYFSTAYPWYFALAGIDVDKIEKAVAFEVELESLDQELIYPDEDFIGQCLSRQFGVPVAEVHDEVCKNMEEYRRHWESSLEKMGNISYKGNVSFKKVTRYVVFDTKKRGTLALAILDPTITPINYFYKGEFYRKLVAWFFGDVKTLPQLDELEQYKAVLPELQYKNGFEFWSKESESREGIELVVL